MQGASVREGSMKVTDRSRNLILWFFFFSGFSGLVYEVVWARLLERVMGASVYSITTVLTVYMAGLGLGSFLAGRFVDRRSDSLRLYGILQGAIGVSCVLVPALLVLLAPVYRSAYQSLNASFQTLTLVRFLISGLALIIPTTLMGATLPVLSRHLATRMNTLGETVGRLYAVNTFGAVVGSFAAGFVLMPRLGIMGAIFFAASINIIIAMLVFWHSRGAGAWSAKSERPRADSGAEAPEGGKRDAALSDSAAARSAPAGGKPSGSRVVVFVLVAFAISGFAAMVYQVAWMRSLSLVIGSSVYAVSLTLTAYILGLALGASIVSRFVDRWEHLLWRLGDIEIGIGAAALIVVPILGRLPLAMIGVVERFSDSFGALMAAEFGIVFLVILVPTVLMGGVFPLVVRICTRRLEAVGRSVGTVYASNTVGAIAGSFVGGFVLVPWLGIQGAISVAVTMSLALGAALTIADTTVRGLRRFGPAAVAALLIVVVLPLLPTWDPVIMSSGSYLYADMYSSQAEAWGLTGEDAIRSFGTVLYHKEGVATTVTVRQARSDIYLQSNGKTEASTGPDMRTQKLLAHAPMMLHPDPNDVLVIGLASGVTVGAALSYPIESVDCVEIAPAMIEVAGTFFAEANEHCMEDPRLSMIIEDGRNHVEFTARTYDVMISQPSNPWIVGISNLFTREFFQMARDRMNDGGVVGMWFQAYNMTEGQFRMIARTFADVFDSATIWELDPGVDYMLIGTVGDAKLDWDVLTARLADASTGADLASIGVNTPLDYTALYLLSPSTIREYAGDGTIHTDNGLQLEFSAPKSMYHQSKAEQLMSLDRFRATPSEIIVGISPEEREAVDARATGRRLLARGIVAEETGRLDEALSLFEEAMDVSPGELEAREALSRLLCQLASTRQSQQRVDEAFAYYERAVTAAPDLPQPRCLLGAAYLGAGDVEAAEREFLHSLDLDPDYAEAHLNMALIHETRGDDELQIKALKSYLRGAPAASNVEQVRERIRQLESRLARGGNSR